MRDRYRYHDEKSGTSSIPPSEIFQKYTLFQKRMQTVKIEKNAVSNSRIRRLMTEQVPALYCILCDDIHDAGKDEYNAQHTDKRHPLRHAVIVMA
jgi:hypothetical protein